MKSLKTFTKFAPVLCGLLLSLGSAQAADISGTISSTMTIFDDSQLVGNVTCTVVHAPCMKFGADHIKLRLNGFSMTGLADPITGCGPMSAGSFFGEDGIDTAGHSDLEIQGPGLVQNFRSVGVYVHHGSTKVKVRHITTSTNCICGILLFNETNNPSFNNGDNDVEDNVAVRIGNFENGCGGMNIRTNNNRVRRNLVSGNGYVTDPQHTTTPPSIENFGINLGGTGNVVEENTSVGNVNGIRIRPGASGNMVRRNVFMGNPPLQVSESFVTFGGVDILNVSSGTNTLEDNLCLTSNVSGLCPNIPAGGDEGER
jgi:hypothetical protein